MEITVKCVGCEKLKKVGEEQKDQPMCDDCFMPMIPVGVTSKFN